MADSEILISIEHLKQWFTVSTGLWSKETVKAVDDVSLNIYRGETFGLVGESGCGKSTLGRTLVKLHEPTAGRIIMKGKDITRLYGDELKSFRKSVQLIFQDPYASLNPRMTVGEIVREPMVIHNLYASRKEQDDKVIELLSLVGLRPDHIRRYPHEFSGGQRQRIAIARTLALGPEFIVCDEPISALDVSIQAQIINLLKKIQSELGLTYLFIAHDLGMVRYISDRIGVMYLGQIVELGSSEELYRMPLHPYTRALVSAALIPDPDAAKEKQRIRLHGEIPSAIAHPSGCPFRPRCPYAAPRCAEESPRLRAAGGHLVACHKV
ncbi:MAG: ATP-binding cassette domain-containing protein [Oscillospiraceae bacterium]|nr:ATP-binding cassette domain-containing protein [Oscillospiraceae bacterium]